MASREGRYTLADLNDTEQQQPTSYISFLQPTTLIVRKGSVMLSRAETVTAYQKQRRGQQTTGTEQQSSTTPNLAGDANDMCALDNWPSHARRNRTQLQNENDGQRKDGRGVLKGYKVSKKRFANSSAKLNVEFSDRLGGTVGTNYRSFVDDVVVLMKRRAPLIGVRKWSDIHSNTQELIVAEMIERWNLENTKDTQDRILKIAKERYRGWRSTLHSTYKAYNNNAARMANAPEEVKPEEWEWLIGYFGSDSKFQEISQKNSDNRKKQKAKHKVGSKSYSQLSYEKRDPETGEEPDSIGLWELTHTRNGLWSNVESQAVYDNARTQVIQKEVETEGPISYEERNNIFQSTYRTTMGCKSSQPRGYGYMAKPPDGGTDRFRVELDEQARATMETQRQNVELNQQVNDLQDQLEAERERTERELARECAGRERVEEQLEQERAERDRLLAEERRARKLELHTLEESMMAKMKNTHQIPETRNGYKPSANSNLPWSNFPTTTSTAAISSKSARLISSH